MILKVSTKDGWVYHGELKNVKMVDALYKLVKDEEINNPPHFEGSFCPQFYNARTMKPEFPEIINMEDTVEIAPKDIPTGEEEAHMLIVAKMARCVTVKGDKFSVGFNSDAYLLNDEGKTVEKFRS